MKNNNFDSMGLRKKSRNKPINGKAGDGGGEVFTKVHGILNHQYEGGGWEAFYQDALCSNLEFLTTLQGKDQRTQSILGKIPCRHL